MNGSSCDFSRGIVQLFVGYLDFSLNARAFDRIVLLNFLCHVIKKFLARGDAFT